MKNKRLFVKPGFLKFAVLYCLFLGRILYAGAQTETVTGIVTDAGTKQPLIGATILVKGTNTGVTTDIKGAFAIKASAKSELVFSYIGYENRTLPVEGKTVLNVELSESANSIEEVVAIGYASIRKRDVTGSITSISSEDIAAKAPVDIFDALQGMSAGLQITSASGEPGAQADIRIRGTSTFGSGTLPLYVVDGMPMDDISAINPQDIASTEILKDAASASIYGSRSANGVIIITTKKGAAGRPKIDVKYLGSVSKVTHLLPLTTPAQMRFLERERNRMGVTSVNLADTLKSFYNSDGNLASLLFRMSQKHQIDMSVSGSTEKMNYYLSTGYYDEDGVIINSGYKRISMRLNTRYEATPRFTLGNNVQLSVVRQNGVPEADIVQGLYDWVPYWNVFDANGNIMHNVGGKKSPYAVAQSMTQLRNNYRASTLVFGELRFNPYLKFTSNLSGDFYLQRYFYYNPQILQSNTGRTEGRDETNLNYNYLTENFLTYNRTAGNHSFTMLLGMSAQAWWTETLRMRGYDYVTDLIYTLNAASLIDTQNSYTRLEEHSMMSGFFRGTYSYRGKYLLAANVRYDGSSRFGSAKRWGAFPSASLAWRLSDESFMKWTRKGLDDAKIRVSYGVTGNESIGNYDAWQKYTSGNLYMGISGIAPLQLAYSELGWEKTAQINAGLDLALIKNKLKVTADYYRKNTSGLLYNVEVPKESGYTTMRKNIGAMENRGIEFSVDYNLIRNKNWDWKINFNYSRNNTLITKLADGVPFYVGSDNAIWVHEGGRLGEFWGYRHDGVFAYDQSNAFDENWKQLTPVFANGTFGGYTLDGQSYNGAVNRKKRTNGDLYKAGDVNWLESPDATDGIIDEKDKVYLGCAQPDFFGGVSSTLSYKKLTLSVQVYYSIGGMVYNRAAYSRNNFGTSVRAPEPNVIRNMWLNPGDDALFPTPNPANSDNRLALSDYWLEDGSYVKLRNVRLSYNFPKKLCERLSLKQIQVFVYGNNLMTFSRYKGFDPEFGSTSPLAFGIDSGRYPRKIELGGGINLTF